MKFTRNDIFTISKKTYNLVRDNTDGDINYLKWIDYIDSRSGEFIWKENTEEGKKSLQNIDLVPENFRERVLQSLNKSACYKEYNSKKGYYNINLGYNFFKNRISIGFESTPKLEDLKIFVEMAKHLDALLLKNGKTIIDEKLFE